MSFYEFQDVITPLSHCVHRIRSLMNQGLGDPTVLNEAMVRLQEALYILEEPEEFLIWYDTMLAEQAAAEEEANRAG
ncbi:MAG: hypothetical protein EAZ99_06425 [Alphaproteobacteria bacterium]|nr:hypothetical protein [Alphaproteobacteria bacterium]TAD90471.1 MAG: hypothetical protein EAZ99_06425 [Alphaproteobacteria bacterium]